MWPLLKALNLPSTSYYKKNSLFNLKYQCARSNIKNEQHEVSKTKLNVGLTQKNTL